MLRALVGLLVLPVAAAAQGARTAAPSCALAPAAADAREALARARDVTGLSKLDGRLARFRAVDVAHQSFQSDRPYPPFFINTLAQDVWLDPVSGAQHTSTSFTGQGNGPTRPGTTLATERAVWLVRDTLRRAVPAAFGGSVDDRPLNVLAVLGDWSRAADVRVAGRCTYREFPRLVLARRGPHGEEWLFLDPKSGFPVKLERETPHYLWGQRRTEYVYATWYGFGDLTLPLGVARLEDGEAEMHRAIGAGGPAAADSAPSLAVPDTALAMAVELPLFLQALPPDTVRVGPSAFLLVNPGYTQAVALVRDTVFVLDATQSEARARQDSAWIGKLFPGRHPVAVVVTDLAWPHIGGVRFRVASGATIVSHRASEPFLRRVVDRRWTRAPDLLERRRASARLRFVAVDSGATRAAGGLRIVPIDGIGSEGALMVWVPGERFLWASDFVQDLRNPSRYVAEVVEAARRAGIAPDKVAAQHIPLTPWSTVEALAPAGTPRAP